MRPSQQPSLGLAATGDKQGVAGVDTPAWPAPARLRNARTLRRPLLALSAALPRLRACLFARDEDLNGVASA